MEVLPVASKSALLVESSVIGGSGISGSLSVTTSTSQWVTGNAIASIGSGSIIASPSINYTFSGSARTSLSAILGTGTSFSSGAQSSATGLFPSASAASGTAFYPSGVSSSVSNAPHTNSTGPGSSSAIGPSSSAMPSYTAIGVVSSGGMVSKSSALTNTNAPADD